METLNNFADTSRILVSSDPTINGPRKTAQIKKVACISEKFELQVPKDSMTLNKKDTNSLESYQVNTVPDHNDGNGKLISHIQSNETLKKSGTILPIQPSGMAVCKWCGDMGVKDAFYTKEREYCSVRCSQLYLQTFKKKQAVPSPLPIYNYPIKVDGSKRSNKGSKLERLISLKSPYRPNRTSQSPKKLRRKTNNTPSDSYDWKPALRLPNFFAASVTCFRHAPGAGCWEDVTGRKVEVENTDCDDSSVFPNTFWVATVLRVCGYFVQLRYEGFEQNSSKDFWLNLCSPDVHSVGWCAMRGNPLIPPKTIEHKQADWKGYLHKQLTGQETLSLNFYSKIEASQECKFKPGMNVELVDKVNISRVKMATVSHVTGKRLILKYYDSEEVQHGFYCHEDSPLLHPVGWAKEVGAQIDAPRDYLLRCDTEDYDENDATKELFLTTHHYMSETYQDIGFKDGMKLEAIDPLNLSTICVATVMEVLLCGYVMIRIDSYDEDPTDSDWFCYHSTSPCIFPAGFCDINDIALTPPKGYRPGKFKWDEYLKRTNFETVPSHLFNKAIPDHGFEVGMRLEAADLMDPRLVCGATISRIVGRLLKVHFDGWEDEYDQWLDCESPDIYPVGWCNLVGHKLEKPGPPGVPCTVPQKQTIKPQKKLRRRPRKSKLSLSPENSANRKVSMDSSQNGGIRDRPERVLRKIVPKQNITDDKSSQLRERRPLRKTSLNQSISENSPDTLVPENNNNSSANEDVPEIESKVAFKNLVHNPKSKSAIEKKKPEIEELKPESKIPVKLETNSIETLLDVNVPVSVRSTEDPIEKPAPSSDRNGTKTERCELPPDQWDIHDVANFLVANNCETYSNNFINEKVNGKTFLSLSKDQVMTLAGMKVGPSLKIQALIEQLKLKGSSGRKSFNVKAISKLQSDK